MTPGISARQAISRKHIRHNPNRRKKPRRRPHRAQRRTVRLENFGGRFAFKIHEVFAIVSYFSNFSNGMPNPSKSSRASWGVLAVVAMVTSMPRV